MGAKYDVENDSFLFVLIRRDLKAGKVRRFDVLMLGTILRGFGLFKVDYYRRFGC